MARKARRIVDVGWDQFTLHTKYAVAFQMLQELGRHAIASELALEHPCL